MKIKIRSDRDRDRGREYKAIEFVDFCAQHEIIFQITAPYKLQQNGTTERKS